MTLKIFVAQDDSGNAWAPDYSHEVDSLEWMLKTAWIDFHHLPSLYVLVVNLRQPSADLVVLTERGVGVLECKGNPGDIHAAADGCWYTGPKRIIAGAYLNPHKQVQKYAEKLRPEILPPLLPSWMKGNPTLENKFKFQTAVCFTNENAQINALKRQLESKQEGSSNEPWEDQFSVMKMDGFNPWIRKLRCGVNLGRAGKFQPFFLRRAALLEIARDALHTVEWQEMLAAMPTGNPYGYLILQNGESRQVFNLTKDDITVGRDPNCDVVIPERYKRVSKSHCRILRGISKIEVIDQSTNGTWVNEFSLNAGSKPRVLTHNTCLTLGGAEPSEKVCQLTFEIYGKSIETAPKTELSTNPQARFKSKERP